MKRKNTLLPDVTDTDLRERAHRLRRMPRGGWTWKYSQCGQCASSPTPTGEFRCYQHGGTRAKERIPEGRVKTHATGEKPPRSSSRPFKHGFYSHEENLRIAELVAHYQAQRLDPDATDDDMLYLRAYLEELMALRPDPHWVTQEREELKAVYRRFENTVTDEGWRRASVRPNQT